MSPAPHGAGGLKYQANAENLLPMKVPPRTGRVG